jgi:citrate lyase subunit beta/citryl-CoA lyase
VPLDRLDVLETAKTAAPDAVMLDLADSVAESKKDAARTNLVQLSVVDLPRFSFVRIATIEESDRVEADLDATVREGVFGTVLPEAESADHIRELDSRLTELERARGLEVGSLKILPLPETARGIREYYNILTASSRVVASLFPSSPIGDLARDVGFAVSEDGLELAYMRSKVVVDSRAAGIEHILDGGFPAEEGFEHDTLRSRRFGYTGRYVNTNAQVAIANDVYVPTPDEIEAARRKVAAWDEAEKAGTVLEDNGRIVGVAGVKQARKLLAFVDRMERAQSVAPSTR